MQKTVWQVLLCSVAAAAIAGGSASASTRQLRPAINVPANCAATPVYGDNSGPASPYIDAQPLFSKIHLTLASQHIPASLTYMPISAGGEDVTVQSSSGTVTIYGTKGRETKAVLLGIFEPTIGYFKTLDVPKPGCWHLRLVAGRNTGYITLWVRPRG